MSIESGVYIRVDSTFTFTLTAAAFIGIGGEQHVDFVTEMPYQLRIATWKIWNVILSLKYWYECKIIIHFMCYQKHNRQKLSKGNLWQKSKSQLKLRTVWLGLRIRS